MQAWPLLCLTVCSVAACEPKIPRGVIACDVDEECPRELVCVATAGEVQKYCDSASVLTAIDASVRLDPGVRTPAGTPEEQVIARAISVLKSRVTAQAPSKG